MISSNKIELYKLYNFTVYQILIQWWLHFEIFDKYVFIYIFHTF